MYSVRIPGLKPRLDIGPVGFPRRKAPLPGSHFLQGAC